MHSFCQVRFCDEEIGKKIIDTYLILTMTVSVSGVDVFRSRVRQYAATVGERMRRLSASHLARSSCGQYQYVILNVFLNLCSTHQSFDQFPLFSCCKASASESCTNAIQTLVLHGNLTFPLRLCLANFTNTKSHAASKSRYVR
jgi:hypothetical protein